MFGAKVLRILIKERKLHRNEISMERNSWSVQLPKTFQGANVPWNEMNVPWNKSSLRGLFAPGNESVGEQKVQIPFILHQLGQSHINNTRKYTPI